MPFLDLSFQSILVRVLAGTVVATLLGAFLAWTADRLGDSGPRHDGRLTLSPARHTGILPLIATTASLTGWTKPLVLDSGGRGRLLGLVLCGEIALFALGIGVTALNPFVAAYWPEASARFGLVVLDALRDTSLGFAVLNILPFPPLLGGYLLQAFVPDAFAYLVKANITVCLLLAASSLALHDLVSTNPVAWVWGKL